MRRPASVLCGHRARACSRFSQVLLSGEDACRSPRSSVELSPRTLTSGLWPVQALQPAAPLPQLGVCSSIQLPSLHHSLKLLGSSRAVTWLVSLASPLRSRPFIAWCFLSWNC